VLHVQVVGDARDHDDRDHRDHAAENPLLHLGATA
jgi:hypothetical protein